MDNEMKNMLSKLLEGQSRLEKKVNDNSTKLEFIENKIDIIAEI
ncbi:hypothetical protein [Abyssisolibacter fermentans]|nr:hypothetical protein [Abyssisolibacter fermentans]